MNAVMGESLEVGSSPVLGPLTSAGAPVRRSSSGVASAREPLHILYPSSNGVQGCAQVGPLLSGYEVNGPVAFSNEGR